MYIIWSLDHICVIRLDQIALPDLAPAAMENWGLVTYQEGSLLYEEGVSSLLEKEWIATLIAHELAHQARTLSILQHPAAFYETCHIA